MNGVNGVNGVNVRTGVLAQPVCPESGVRGCVVGRVKVLDPCRHVRVRKECVFGARASSSRRKACWRFEYAGPRMSRHASHIRCKLLCPVWEPLCRVAYAAVYVSCRMGVSRTIWRPKCRVVYVRSCAVRRMEGFCPCLETKMSGCVCPGMRNPQSTARRYRIPSISVRLRMPRHTGRARAGRNDDQDSRTSCTRHTS